MCLPIDVALSVSVAGDIHAAQERTYGLPFKKNIINKKGNRCPLTDCESVDATRMGCMWGETERHASRHGMGGGGG